MDLNASFFFILVLSFGARALSVARTDTPTVGLHTRKEERKEKEGKKRRRRQRWRGVQGLWETLKQRARC